MTLRKISRALLSVSDKSGLVEFARGLQSLGVELISTGGTRKALADAGLAVRDVASVTGFPEMLDGRVKTLHPLVHGGILAIRENPDHQAAAAAHQIGMIDLVVVNLYPFEQTVAKADVSPEEVIENIDIGGPSMVRSAAKNHHDVVVLTDPADYAKVLEELQTKGGTELDLRRRLAAKAFARTAAYDAAISSWFAMQTGDAFPATLNLTFQRRSLLRYGENPHQEAAFYVDPRANYACVARAEVLQGKELSYNNLLDLDSALNLVREFAGPAAVVLKHNNPCGAATAANLADAFQRAWEGDPLSAFGGIIGFNREVDEATARLIVADKKFVECIIAPGFSAGALEVLKPKEKMRLLQTGPITSMTSCRDYRRIDGGMLAQDRDLAGDVAKFEIRTQRSPTEAEWADLRFAWLVCKHVKSNAIVLARGGMVVGVGAGQMSRVFAVQQAVTKAQDRSQGSVLASDAFFPFPDNVEEAAKAGVTAIIQPGGSVKDKDSVAACDAHGIAMVFTGIRHFRH